MEILGLLFLLIVPYFIGTMFTSILRERNGSMLNSYLTGFLSLFVVLGGLLLVSLKLDLDFKTIEKIYITLVSGLTLISLPFYVLKARRTLVDIPFKHKSIKGKRTLTIVSFVIGLLSYVFTVPSFVNEDIYEMVETTVTTGKLYEYSALTGQTMEAGLPIFSKIYIPGLFYSIFVDAYGIPMWLLGGIIVPAVIFTLSIMLAYEIGNKRPQFAFCYLTLLVVGTYLPGKGVPVTIGYALLREPYSGYAIVYGIVVPYVVYLLKNRRFVHSVLAAVPAVFLMRLDRIYYALISPLESYKDVNTAGKLVIIYITAVIAYIIYRGNNHKYRFTWLMLCPSLMISETVTEFGDEIKVGKKRFLFYFGAAICALLSSTSFPYSDTVSTLRYDKTDSEIEEVLDAVSDHYEGALIYAPESMMEEARRTHGDIKTLYSKKAWDTMMAGIDYEELPEDIEDYLFFMTNMENNNNYMPVSYTTKALLLNAQNLGMNTLIVPTRSINADFLAGIKYIDFEVAERVGDYTIFR